VRPRRHSVTRFIPWTPSLEGVANNGFQGAGDRLLQGYLG
jgi:hypothetical protein